MLQKVLVANRGEIALRIIRACQELGIKTVAVYSEADAHSLPAQFADEAICIGPAPSAQSYLRPERILSAAELTDVDGIHPGFGYLSERADFAEQCERCNIKFIGPSSKTIGMMGDKAQAREVAKKAGVPITPGSDGPVRNAKDALATAQKIGFPVIIKAVAGGGGKGMRLAHNAAAFVKELDMAQGEAEKVFGNGDVYLEKFIEEPRHIEFQILADERGNVVHLGERDCSVQRRYQKLIEEAPSPFLTPKLRKKMGDAAVRLAKACNYMNAGTVEFLVDKDSNFYFMEMNTRIQVEHGVTEEATGYDLIKQQIQIASGEPLAFKQSDIKLYRHAIECRINAEDAANNFRPSPGEITFYSQPGGHGVRVDTHVYQGYTISPHYDSMIGKLMTFGDTREIALDRMNRALREYLIHGIATSIPFCQAIVNDPTFREGKQVTTKYLDAFVDRTPKDLFTKKKP
tara:strand:+ start:18447 stop:19826 length:1380 start_codon:yes stop_codon:yes gene_type:complete